jgi:hypothetical protein
MPFFKRRDPRGAQSLQPLDDVLLDWGRFDTAVWTARDAVRGTLILGSVGTGKTSLSGAVLASEYLKAGYGGLVLTAKPDETTRWLQWAIKYGRREDVVLIRPDLPTSINFIGDMLAAGQPVANIVTVFDVAAELAEKDAQKQGGGDPFWSREVGRLLSAAITTLKYADTPKNLATMQALIRSAPRSSEDLESPAWRDQSELYQALCDCKERSRRGPLDRITRDELAAIDEYWGEEYPGTPFKQRSGMLSTYKNLLNAIVAVDIKPLFNHQTTVDPNACNDGQIQILDMNAMQHGQAGIFSQGVWKYIWLRIMQQRTGGRGERPCFLWVDEAPYFVTKYDAQFVNVTRQAQIMPVYIAQTISQFERRLTKEGSRELMAGLNTKIIHKLDDVEDMKWVADFIGRRKKSNISYNRKARRGDDPDSTHQSFTDEYIVTPYEIANLRTGSPHGAYQRIFIAPDQRFGKKNADRHILDDLYFAA